MKKIILSLVLVISIVISGCSFQLSDKTRGNEDKSNVRMKESNMENVSFSGLNDPELQSYIEENVYQSVLKNIDTNEYFVENVQAVYISQEYIDDLTYNSQSNIFFGYTLADLDMEFEGEKYVFNVDDNGKTKVELFEEYDDTYEQIIKNVAIGTGVILICVTVSVITAGADAPAIAYIFAGAAKSGTGFALSSAAIGGTASSAITYAKTGNVEESLKQGALDASEEFKWGAILGSVTGGVGKACALKGVTLNGLTINEAALIQKESKWSPKTIKQIKSLEEYKVYKKAGLIEKEVNGQKALVKNIDLEYVSKLSDGSKITNLERMKKGYSPIDAATGKAYQLHHIGQKSEGTLAILTEAEHQGNASILNISGKISEIDRTAFNKVRKEFWMSFAKKVG
ncbi:MAG: HNH/ENDO VII family nuclease [Lachnospiraceae bacterium]|nr:HNH/ENDO VII family nuclease [Lachnospiraceae bacterium]